MSIWLIKGFFGRINQNIIKVMITNIASILLFKITILLRQDSIYRIIF